eukprot:TRINITY_DN45948_c0_g1_i1.p1 TRINITY_DN45948_c0_g1~~TRINITY_DN45948_c0_g1_i1.p1  ORF type:complete len:172 (-),score=35.99 TRINITY_DN45948_c0_g1_i1:154-669(-)
MGKGGNGKGGFGYGCGYGGYGGPACFAFGKGLFDMGKGGLPWQEPKNVKGLIWALCNSNVLPGGKRWENDDNTLFVGGLPDDTSDIDLYTIFAPFGAIAPRGASAMKDKETGKCTGVGFINYLDAAAAKSAIQALNGTVMSDGSRLYVKVKGPPKSKGDGKSNVQPAVRTE